MTLNHALLLKGLRHDLDGCYWGDIIFESRPAIEGIKTANAGYSVRIVDFESRPAIEGIKTHGYMVLPRSQSFESRPAIEGIKTYLSSHKKNELFL